MEIMEVKPGCIEEQENLVENVEKRFCEKRSVAGALIGVLIAKNKIKKRACWPFFLIFYLALSYFLRGLPPKYRRR